MAEDRHELPPPRLVIPNAARRWFTTRNYDLLVYSDRLVAVKGLTLRGGMQDERRDVQVRAVLGVPDSKSVWERQRARSEQRVAALITNGELGSAESSDQILVPLSDVASAKLGKRVGVVSLRLWLKDGSKLSWRWMNHSLAKPYADAAPVLRDVLGNLLRR